MGAHTYFEPVRRIPSFGLALALLASAFAMPARADLPQQPDELVAAIQTAIETKDYETFKELVFWKDAGEIKQRIVRFQINRGLGRPIQSISFEDVSEHALDAIKATGKLEPNMVITNRVRVVYDEAPIDASGKKPTSVFLVGKVDGDYRIGLVVRKPGFDDDDD
jgi:hypothetical protein